MADKDCLISQEYLNQLFTYTEGKLFWKNPTLRSKMKAGERAGTKSLDNRIYVTIHSKRFAEHRLIFMLHHGWFPKEVDHIDTNTLNNDIKNLRAATPSQNKSNRGIMRNNTSGVKGVNWQKNAKKWCASCQVNKKRVRLGYFENIEDAEKAVKSAREQLHGQFARHL